MVMMKYLLPITLELKNIEITKFKLSYYTR